MYMQFYHFMNYYTTSIFSGVAGGRPGDGGQEVPGGGGAGGQAEVGVCQHVQVLPRRCHRSLQQVPVLVDLKFTV